ncbi:hypothetical protein GDO78_022810 [Eleutherodactylus coqui]|uniref:Uncharacterized protein n=1 Tax=Eleutherodactylus coqui TaxID=57060 RepID=A0A8J6EG94_ELECQ|nr:hypothetical protein GDO78_022810 [Eleutherodactylus coqui]
MANYKYGSTRVLFGQPFTLQWTWRLRWSSICWSRSALISYASLSLRPQGVTLCSSDALKSKYRHNS